MMNELDRGYTVRECMKKNTEEPEGQYNRMVVRYKGKNYEVRGRPFCFAGYCVESIIGDCRKLVEQHLNSKK